MLNNDPTYRLEEARRIVESRISPRTATPRHTGRLRMRLFGPRGAPRRGWAASILAAGYTTRRSGATPLVRRFVVWTRPAFTTG